MTFLTELNSGPLSRFSLGYLILLWYTCNGSFQVEWSLIGKPVGIRRGPATVTGEHGASCHWRVLGRRTGQ